MKNFDKFFDELHRTTVGLENMFDYEKHRISKSTNFPPYNIRKKNDTQYQIELAVAGFSEEDIEIKVEKNIITVKSEGHKLLLDKNNNEELIYQGFTYRGFERNFNLMDNVKAMSAEMKNGVLIIHLEKIIPEEDKPKTIQIVGSKQKLLSENSL